MLYVALCLCFCLVLHPYVIAALILDRCALASDESEVEDLGPDQAEMFVYVLLIVVGSFAMLRLVP